MSIIQDQRKDRKNILEAILYGIGIISLFFWATSCRAYRPDGSPTFNTRLLMKKDSVGVKTGHGYVKFKKTTDTVKK